MKSLFTKIIEGEIPSYKIDEDDKFFAFLDINPLTEGHVLIVPKQQTDYYFDLPDELLKEMTVYSKKIANAIRKSIRCKRVGIMIMGFDVPHAHLHLIPINVTKDMDITKPRLKLTPEEFKKIAEKIKKEL